MSAKNQQKFRSIMLSIVLSSIPVVAFPCTLGSVQAPNFQAFAERFAQLVEAGDAKGMSRLINNPALWDSYLKSYVLGPDASSFRSIIGSQYSIVVYAWKARLWHADFFIIPRALTKNTDRPLIQDLPKNGGNTSYIVCRVVQSKEGNAVEMDENFCFLETDALNDE